MKKIVESHHIRPPPWPSSGSTRSPRDSTDERTPNPIKRTTVNENERTWNLLERVLHKPYIQTIFLTGEPGIGKSYAAYTLATKPGVKIYAVTLTEDTPSAELRGFFHLKGQEVDFQLGPFGEAMLCGGPLVINEVGHAPPEVQSLMYAVLESPETARLTLPDGRTIRPQPGFKVILTDNGPLDLLPEAIQDRVDAHFEIKDAHPKALALMTPRIRRIWETSREISGTKRFSLRDCFRLQNLLRDEKDFGLDDACYAAFGPKRGPQMHDAIVLMEAAR